MQSGGFDGLIDEVQIYNRALSAGEIGQLIDTGTTLYVDEDGQVGFVASVRCDGVGIGAYTTIQDAIDAASAGDTIAVCPGTGPYTEDLSITTDDLELVGLSASPGPTIKGVETTLGASFPLAEPNINILANGVSIHGFTIESPDTPEDTYSSGVVLTGTDIEIYDNEFLVSRGDPGSVAIQTWAAVNTPPGPGDISGLSIHNNTFSDLPGDDEGFGYEGIFINPQDDEEDSDNPVVITDNTFSGRLWRAVGVYERDYVVVGGSGNTITTDLPNVDEPATGYPLGVKVWGSDHISVLGNTITDGGAGVFAVGITLQGTLNVTAGLVSGNTVRGAAQNGIHLKSGYDGWVLSDNTVANGGGNGIQVESDNNDIHNNGANHNGANGILVTADGNTLSHNEASFNTADGIHVDGTDNDLYGNNAHHNGDDGIEALGTGDCAITGVDRNKAKFNGDQQFVSCP